jgi:hypothetical protein
MGTCGSLQDAKSPDEVTVEQWETCRLALTGASSNIVGAIACLAKQASPELEQEFGSVIDQLIKLGEELLDAWPQVEDRDPVIQHLRMIGAWLVATKRPKLAKRAAAVVAKASPYTGWDLADSRYPTDLSSDDWHRVPISVAGQYAMPHYLGIVHAFLDHGHREKFEKMIDIARRGAGASAPTERAPLSRTPRAADIPTKRS